jgi:hypothetical protein
MLKGTRQVLVKFYYNLLQKELCDDEKK